MDWFNIFMAVIASVSALVAILSLRQTRRNVDINARRDHAERQPRFRAEFQNAQSAPQGQRGDIVRFYYEGPEELASVDVELNIALPGRNSPLLAIGSEREPPDPSTQFADLRCPLRPGDERFVWVLRSNNEGPKANDALFYLICHGNGSDRWVAAVSCSIPRDPMVIFT